MCESSSNRACPLQRYWSFAVVYRRSYPYGIAQAQQENSMPPRPMVQIALFEDASAVPLPTLPQDVQIQLQQQMVQWIRAIAVAINQGEDDEQDHR